MDIKSFALSICLSGLALVAQAGPPLSIGLVAQTGGDAAIFQSLGAPKIHHGQVMFMAKTSTNSGVYVYSQGKIYPLATSDTPLPEGMGYFRHFSPTTFALGDAAAVFVASGSGWQEGIYLWRQGQLTTVADTDTPVYSDPKDHFVDFLAPTLVTDQDLVFIGKTFKGRSLILEWQAGKLSHPVALAPKAALLGLSAAGSRIVWITEKNQEGFIQSWDGQTLQTLLSPNTNLPHQSVGYFTHFAGLSLDQNSDALAVIGGGILGQKGVYALSQGQLLVVADKGSLIPEGLGSFTNFSEVSMDQGSVIFYGTGEFQQAGIYLFSLTDQALLKIFSTQDKINQAPLTAIVLGPQAISGRQIACLVKFQDDSEAIAMISLK